VRPREGIRPVVISTATDPAWTELRTGFSDPVGHRRVPAARPQTARTLGVARMKQFSVQSGLLALAIMATLAGDVAVAKPRWLRDANTAPVASGSPPPSIAAGETYAFAPEVYDADGDALSFRIRNKPGWARFDSLTGTLRGRPSSADQGTYSRISISVNDGIATVTMPSFSIEVTASAASAPNPAPVISGTPDGDVVTGELYAFQPSASDPNGDTLTFSAQNVPAWANFSSATGRLYGTPGTAAIGTYADVTISVSDGVSRTSIAPFSIVVVAAPNSAPAISGVPQDAVTAGQSYSFRPSATDADGDVLTFAIRNRPSWAAFDSRTGAMSGQPQAGDTGNYADIVVSVSDGSASAELAPFAVTVLPAQSGTVSLSWSPPTDNIDGSPIVGLSGFKVFYGQVSRQYSEVLSLMSAELTSVMIENLAPANWYFAVKAVSSAGVESDFSPEVSKLIR
jgi:hypothetical protein